jgi:hypothetical protein
MLFVRVCQAISLAGLLMWAMALGAARASGDTSDPQGLWWDAIGRAYLTESVLCPSDRLVRHGARGPAPGPIRAGSTAGIRYSTARAEIALGRVGCFARPVVFAQAAPFQLPGDRRGGARPEPENPLARLPGAIVAFMFGVLGTALVARRRIGSA